jgi:hypothetical protein
MMDRRVLLRSTILWIMAVTWVVWSYLIQDPAPDAWAALTRNAFTMVFAVVASVVSLILLGAWIRVLVNAERRRDDPGAATH